MTETMPITRYEDEYLYYVRKPHGIPTTFGSQFSFLEEIAAQRPDFFVKLANERTWEEEWGLVNRLDNDTAGLIYFAKTKAAADRYHACQEKGELLKRYVCDVVGNMAHFINTDTHVNWCDDPYNNEKSLCVSYPLMHHAYDDQRMIALHHPSDAKKGRGKEHGVKTYFIPLYYDEERNITTAYALIVKGMRHQIRAHAAAMGYPLVGDILYKGLSSDKLHLWSVGLTSAK